MEIVVVLLTTQDVSLVFEQGIAIPCVVSGTILTKSLLSSRGRIDPPRTGIQKGFLKLRKMRRLVIKSGSEGIGFIAEQTGFDLPLLKNFRIFPVFIFF